MKQHADLDAANILYANSFTGILVTLISSSVLVYLFFDANSSQFKQIWFIAMLFVLALRFADALHWRNTPQKEGKKSIIRFVCGTYATAGLWCLYTLVVMPNASLIELACIIITMSGMAGGGTTVLSAHAKTSIIYPVILLAPGSTWLLLSGEKHQQLLGLLGMMFFIAMIVAAKKTANFTSFAIKLKNENALLVAQMEQKVEQRTQKIYELSNLDPLSELYNRTAFLRYLDQHMKDTPNNSLAVLFIDLDKFKEINDSLGHDTGDILLQQTAQRLRESCHNQQILCRWGGDEFLIALDCLNKEAAIAFATTLIANISQPYQIHGNQCVIGATIGIAMFPEHASTAEQLIQLADTAMYHQKNSQPSQVEVFSKALNEELKREQKLKEGLKTAIEKQQLSLAYQPIISTESFEVTCCEALLRWQLDDDNISPTEFIPLAEQYGHITKLGAWVLQQACLDAKKWPRDIAIAVNVSNLQLQDPKFIEVLDDALDKSQLSPHRLHIEITESVFSSDQATLIQRITAMQERGIKVSIDDFGTEYSSLSVIQNLGVNLIKIDRSFIQQIDDNGYAIIQAVVQIAVALGYKVVAEGVEYQTQANKLTAMNVDYLQGYLYAKPMNSELLATYLEES